MLTFDKFKREAMLFCSETGRPAKRVHMSVSQLNELAGDLFKRGLLPKDAKVYYAADEMPRCQIMGVQVVHSETGLHFVG